MPVSSPHPSGPFLPGEILVISAAQLSGTVLCMEPRPATQPLQGAAALVPCARVRGELFVFPSLIALIFLSGFAVSGLWGPTEGSSILGAAGALDLCKPLPAPMPGVRLNLIHFYVAGIKCGVVFMQIQKFSTARVIDSLH